MFSKEIGIKEEVIRRVQRFKVLEVGYPRERRISVDMEIMENFSGITEDINAGVGVVGRSRTP